MLIFSIFAPGYAEKAVLNHGAEPSTHTPLQCLLRSFVLWICAMKVTSPCHTGDCSGVFEGFGLCSLPISEENRRRD